MHNASVTGVPGTLGTREECQTQCPTAQNSQQPAKAIIEYLMERVPEYRLLRELREKGWQNPKGDLFFQRQRHQADNADRSTSRHFFNMMKKIGREIHDATGVLQIETPSSEHSRILDMCMAPGGFIATVLSLNPRSRTSGFTLPPSDGGHEVLLPRSTNVILKYLDITMLAEDMGVTKIQADHPDVKNFFPKQFEEGQAFHLVLCDGQVLRTQERAPYRKQREARRLINSQLALGLEHVRPGGTMIVLLHKAEAWDTVQLMYTFSKFSSVQLIKPMWFHAKRSSFYMVATKIQSHHPQAILAIEKWKEIWKVATFGTDEAYMETICKFETDVEVILRDFGEELVRLGKTVWDIQAKALARAPFIKAQENK